MPFCTGCGKEMPAEDRFCTKCGRAVPGSDIHRRPETGRRPEPTPVGPPPMPPSRAVPVIAIVAGVALLVLFAAALAGVAAWRSAQRSRADSPIRPVFERSISGRGDDALDSPTGVLIEGERLLVADAKRGRVTVFTPDGDFVEHIGAGKLKSPADIAKHPRTGEYFVADVRADSLEVFSAEGAWLRTFEPSLPASDGAPPGEQWAPHAVAFAEDGTMYVADTLDEHRLLIFDPRGDLVRAVGRSGTAIDAGSDPDAFAFPSRIRVHGDEVWVADANNRRLKVFDRDGELLRIVPTEGLPRGFDFVTRDGSPTWSLVVVDVLAHECRVLDPVGVEEWVFGGLGANDGQFMYPSCVSVGPDVLAVTDTRNGRVQLWRY